MEKKYVKNMTLVAASVFLIFSASAVYPSAGRNAYTSKPKKRYWTPREDDLLKHAVKQIGTQDWKQIASLVGSRNAKQCRDRWLEHLDPTIKHGNWTREEDQFLLILHQKHGNKWAKIARNFPNRTGAEIKNHWNNAFPKNYYLSKSQKIVIQRPQAALSDFNFFDYPFDIEDENWFPELEQ
jgi:hypothetical protein